MWWKAPAGWCRGNSLAGGLKIKQEFSLHLHPINARMAKLVDALSSGGSVRKDVLVRIQSRAQKPHQILMRFLLIGPPYYSYTLEYTVTHFSRWNFSKLWNDPVTVDLFACFIKAAFFTSFKIGTFYSFGVFFLNSHPWSHRVPAFGMAKCNPGV